MVDGAPEIMLHAVDLNENLIQVPLPLGVLAHEVGAFHPDLAGEDWTKTINAGPHAFVANVDAALVK